MSLFRRLLWSVLRRHDWVTVGRAGRVRIQACTRCHGLRVKGRKGSAK